MSDGQEDAKLAWVARVLGIASGDGVQPAAPAQMQFAQRWRPVREAWTDASYVADQQITALQGVLRKSGDEALVDIAEFGLNAVTGGHKVKLTAALRELDGGDAGAVATAAPKTLALVRAFRGHLTSDAHVRACDGNPFGIKMTLQATLDAALVDMEKVLAGAAP